LATALTNQGLSTELRPQQGFDHGAWVPYMHLFPNGGPSMIQLSMPVNWTGETALSAGTIVGEFARSNHAVVVGSGSLTHNFRDMDMGSANPSKADNAAALAYVNEFNAWIQHALTTGNTDAIARAEFKAPHFAQAHPDNDHYLPLPFAVGAAPANFGVGVLPEDVRYRALSMQSFAFTS
jgi:4,5-DOPA dioxygenase extradiol